MAEDMPSIEVVFASLPGADDDADVYATAEAVREATGLSKSTVNDRLRELVSTGRVLKSEDNPPAYRQAASAEQQEADAAASDAEASQEEWPETADVPTGSTDPATVVGGETADAPPEGGKTTRKPRKAAAPKQRRKFTTGGLQDEVLAALRKEPERTWFIYELAQQLNAYPTSVGYALKQLAGKGEATQGTSGARLTYKAS